MSVLRLFYHHQNEPLLFNSGTFFLCFTLFIAGYIMLLGRGRSRVLYVLAFSAFYYYKCNGIFALALLFTTSADFLLARLIYRAKTQRARRWLTATSILLSLGIIGYFKYASFSLGIFGWLSGQDVPKLTIFLPIGISFYSFQSISYVIDVYRGNHQPRESFVDYAFYLSFFPQIVAGPIVRAEDFFPQINRRPTISSADVRTGLFLIVRGLIKKAILADFLGIYSDLIYATPSGYAGPEIALALYAYAFQIYFDFSGYSDMAIGMARVLGFQLPENFNAPYRSANITEFWQRWHITLSTWLRDYLYIPLGGGRCAPWRRNLNLLITMLLGGLWHGAAWTFVVWGGLHGVALGVHKWFSSRAVALRGPHATAAPIWHKLLAIFATFHFVTLGWVLFRAPSFSVAGAVLTRLVQGWSLNTLLTIASARRSELLAVTVAALLCALPRRAPALLERVFVKAPVLLRASVLLMVIQGLIQLRFTNVQPFIYFQF